MKKIMLISLITLMCLPLYSQWDNVGFSKWVTHFPKAYVFDKNNIYIGLQPAISSFSQIILFTDDLGDNWDTVASLPYNGFYLMLHEYFFYNQDTGLIFSNHKMIRTIDRGKSWKVMDSTMEGGMRFYHNPYNNDVFAQGHYILYKSSDYGSTWKQVWDTLFYDIQFTSAKVGYAYTTPWTDVYFSTIYKTSDGGESWDPIYIINEKIKKLDMVNENLGYILTWKVVDNSGIHVGHVYKTRDGGKSWQKAMNNLPTDALVHGLLSISFADSNIGYATWYNGTAAVYKTEDGGGMWRKLAYNSFACILWNLTAIDAQTVMLWPARDNNNCIYRTTTGGGPYSEVEDNETNSISNITIHPNPTNGKISINMGSENGKAFLYNMQGALIIEKKLGPEQNSINLGPLEIGMYILQVSTKSGGYVRKVVKE